MVQAHGPALVNASGLRGFDAYALALLDEAKLHFGDHTQHSEHHLAHRPLGVDGRFKHTQSGTLLIQFMDDIEHVAGGSAQTVQPRHHEDVPLTDKVQDALEFVAALTRTARHLLYTDRFAAFRLEPGYLGVCLLVRGRNAGITDERR